MDTWPATLPQRLSSDTSVQDDESRAISDMDSGPPSVRNRFTAITQTIKGSMVLTGAQLATFLIFFRTTIKHGSLSFYWIHPFTEETVEIRFKSKPEWKCIKPAADVDERLYQASFELEVQP
ncbi:MAG TPA: hypothetical protein PLC32_07180 [Candidatus Omnitrophota bacterium]|nr:hypothetical protein [Candidatus Omnitrophota bacterium]